MMRGMPTVAALAIAACIGAPNPADAALTPAPDAIAVQPVAQQSVQLAQAATTATTTTKKTKRLKVEHPKTNWLNPQPEPPMTGKKPVQGNNWLNPQPEPPRPDTTKKLQ